MVSIYTYTVWFAEGAYCQNHSCFLVLYYGVIMNVIVWYIHTRTKWASLTLFHVCVLYYNVHNKTPIKSHK